MRFLQLIRMAEITALEIRGMFGSQNVVLDVSDSALVLVGPNGLGKSNAASIFYLFSTRQWARLLDHSFDSIVAHFGSVTHELSRTDIFGISEMSEVLSDRRLPLSIRRNLDKIKNAGELESFLTANNLSGIERRRLSSLLDMTPFDVTRIQSYLRSRFQSGDDLQSPSKSAINQLLSEGSHRRTIYLPTYRRIEKELKQIFPDIEDRIRSAETGRRTSVEAKTYIDLVSFGMEDVKAAIAAKLEYLRSYSLVQFNSLSGTYLRDVIRGTATAFKMSQIKGIDDDTLSDILGRVSESTLGVADKEVLRSRIKSLKLARRKADIDLNDQYLVHYFSRLMEVYDDIRLKESEVSSFVDVCNRYLKPSKSLVFDDVGFSLKVMDDRGRELDLSHLSSGEKQVVSLFAHLYLEGAGDNVIIIDEPELSLSVPWQKRFLPDLLESGRCGFIFAVTHSPFIYQNRLKGFTKDFRGLISSYV